MKRVNSIYNSQIISTVINKNKKKEETGEYVIGFIYRKVSRAT